MKSALIRVLFLIFATGVFGDAEKVSVIEGDSVTLHTAVTEIQSSDEIEWRLNGNLIAEISGGSIKTEGASKDRLKLDKQTGDLKITNIETTDYGEYNLDISRTSGSSVQTFSVSGVSGVDEVKSVSVIVGDSVTLNSGTIIQRDDVIEWRFGDLNSLIAEHNRKTGNFSTSDGPDGRFRDRLQLDPQTGSLTIRNTRTEHAGVYEAGIRKSSSAHTIHKSYSVTVSGEMQSVSVMKGDSVTLNSDLTEIQTDDFMLWMFEDSVLAEINKAQKRFLTSDGPDGRFRGRLKLDTKTGSLTITDTTTEHTGVYELKIIISRFTINKRITVTVTVTVTGEMQSVSVMKGDSVTLHTGLTEIQTDDVMQWMFEDSDLAEINKAQKRFSTSDGPDGIFRDRLKLNNQTGSLNITHTRFTDAGLYKLKISNSRFIINKRITVTVTDPGLSPGAIAAIVIGAVLLVCVGAAAGVFYQRCRISELKQAHQTASMKPVSVKEGGSVKLKTGVADIQKVDEILWKCGLFTPFAQIRGGTKKIFPLANKIFQDRLEMDETGSLTINNSNPKDAGIYMLYINEGGNIKTKLFMVKVVINPENVPLRSVHADSGL